MAPRPPRTPIKPRKPGPEALGYALGLLALVALLVACRGAPLGVPAADDYDYLDALLRPVDPFGPMGSIWYWRPLSRQLYFGALGNAFFTAPPSSP